MLGDVKSGHMKESRNLRFLILLIFSWDQEVEYEEEKKSLENVDIAIAYLLMGDISFKMGNCKATYEYKVIMK